MKKNGAVVLHVYVKELDKINELIVEHKRIIDCLNKNIRMLCGCKLSPEITMVEVSKVGQPISEKYSEYDFDISINKVDEVNELVSAHASLVSLLYDNFLKLCGHNWSVEMVEPENE